MHAKMLYEQFTGSYSKKKTDENPPKTQPIIKTTEKLKNIGKTNTQSVISSNYGRSPIKPGHITSMQNVI